MADIPSSGYWENAARTEAEQKQWGEDIRDKLSQIPGAAAETELTVASGSITIPTRNSGSHTVDTESDAATDNLDSIDQSNIEDGGLVYLRAENAARVVTIRHAQGGTGEIVLNDSANFALDTDDKWIVLQRRGTQWIERDRSPRPVVDGGTGSSTASAARTALGAAGTGTANTFTEDQTIESDTAGAAAGPFLTLYRAITGAADNLIGAVLYKGQSDNGTERTYAKSQGEIETATDGSEDGRTSFWSMIAGTLTKVLVIGKGLYTPNATGGDPGADGINFSIVQRDGDDIYPSKWESVISLSGAAGAAAFTSIPSWVKKITINLNGASSDGTGNFFILIGDSGGFESSGYSGTVSQNDNGGETLSAHDIGFRLHGGTSSASSVYSGSVVLSALDSNRDTWCVEGVISRTDDTVINFLGGDKTLNGALDRVRISLTGGSVFDAGELNLILE